MTYREEFPEFESEIPAVFLNHPWRDVSWHNDTCPSFCRTFDGTREIHVYVDEADPTKRDYSTARGGEQHPLPRFTVRTTNGEGSFDEDDVGYSSDSLATVLDHVGVLAGEISR
jgi:hypothetical protein